MIEIKELTIESRGRRARLCANVVLDGEKRPLWVEVDKRYEEYLQKDRCDAFVAGLMFCAIKQRHDIRFDVPITDELKDGIEHDFLDVLCQHQPRLYRPKLIGETIPCLPKSKVVLGAGISCGVDSLFTFKRRIEQSKSEKYLVIANQHGHVLNDSNEKRRFRFEYLKNKAESFSKDVQLPLIVCDTNYNSSGISGLAFEGCTTYGNLFVVMALGKLFTHYYIASGGPVVDFKKYLAAGIYGTDCSNYDLLTCQAFSTRTLRFIVDGLEDRTQKLMVLSDYPLAWKHLDVCHVHPLGTTRNCTNGCPKCMYTILGIWAHGWATLEKFSRVFDLEYVKNHKHEYLAELMRKRLIRAETAMETWPYRKNMGFEIGDYRKACWIVFKKIIKKVLRGGSTASEFKIGG